MDKKLLLECWKEYRGSHEGYLLTSKEAWEHIQGTIINRNLPVYERLVTAVYESHYCRAHDC